MYQVKITEKTNNDASWEEILKEAYDVYQLQRLTVLPVAIGNVVLAFIENSPMVGLIGRAAKYGSPNKIFIGIDVFCSIGPIAQKRSGGVVWVCDFEVHEILAKG